ncbi:MAG: isoprenylcysteine carboxylmethyltransferase family protein [Burkholderiaceae bacterium]|nr:isoprenylcysteine carboxylmethyltransferase family protein [Burkholderiaceae bacterium]
MRAVFALYALVAYATFLVSFLYAIGFVGNLIVPKSIDSGVAGNSWIALLVDALLLGAFAIPHSVMARPAFKRWWAGIVPRAIERSTYVLVSSLLLGVMYRYWQPLPAVVWEVESALPATLLSGVFWLGWLIVLLSTFMISHFELFGLTQAMRSRAAAASHSPVLVTRFLYRFVRHPIMLGFLLAFWATPRMTLGHLLFAVMTTAYIVVGVLLEERDLVAIFGRAYLDYRKRVPMLIPSGRSVGVDELSAGAASPTAVDALGRPIPASLKRSSRVH